MQVKYLHMFLLYYFYSDNVTAAMREYEQFSWQYEEVGRVARSVVSPHTVSPLYRAGRLCYKSVTPLTIACLHNDPDLVDCLISRLGADIHVKCARRNRWTVQSVVRTFTFLLADTRPGLTSLG